MDAVTPVALKLFRAAHVVRTAAPWTSKTSQGLHIAPLLCPPLKVLWISDAQSVSGLYRFDYVGANVEGILRGEKNARACA